MLERAIMVAKRVRTCLEAMLIPLAGCAIPVPEKESREPEKRDYDD